MALARVLGPKKPLFTEYIAFVEERLKSLESDCSKLIQEQRLLGTLLAMPETIELFGKDQVFEMRGLLCEKTGHDLRNRLAHGFLTYNQCWNSDVMNVWWLVIRLVSFPIAERSGVLTRDVGKDEDDRSKEKETESS